MEFFIGQELDRFSGEANTWAMENGAEIVFSIEKDKHLIVPASQEVLAVRSAMSIEQEISSLKSRLAETDYVVTKIAEGVATKEEYAEVLENRAKWRARINELDLIAYPDKPRVDLETAPL